MYCHQRLYQYRGGPYYDRTKGVDDVPQHMFTKLLCRVYDEYKE